MSCHGIHKSEWVTWWDRAVPGPHRCQATTPPPSSPPSRLLRTLRDFSERPEDASGCRWLDPDLWKMIHCCFCFHLGDLLQKNIKGRLDDLQVPADKLKKSRFHYLWEKYFVSPVELVDNAGQGSFQHDMLKVWCRRWRVLGRENVE